MEKFEKMQKNMIADEDLDQITGGKGLFDIFTADFKGFKKDPVTLEMREDEGDAFKATTLEMRANPLDQDKNNRKVVKL